MNVIMFTKNSLFKLRYNYFLFTAKNYREVPLYFNTEKKSRVIKPKKNCRNHDNFH